MILYDYSTEGDNMERRSCRSFKVGNVGVGGEYSISIQSMTNTDTRDWKSTVAQVEALAKAGAKMVRVTVPDIEAADALKIICKESTVPIIADIHFDYKMALKAIENGVSALRINPGNIGSEANVEKVVARAKEFDIPIRIGVNSGSIPRDILEKYGHPTAEGLVESALRHVVILEKLQFEKIKISLKSSNVPMMIDAYRLMAKKVDYPLHLGVTEAGNVRHGTVKSAIGIGTLLAEGIGDTIRVSLTGDPLAEIPVAKQILRALGLIDEGVELISCPTCGRTKIDLTAMVEKIDRMTSHIKKPLKVAVMGCVVNGPGEAREADIGLAGGDGQGIIFKKGEVIAQVKEEDLVDALLEEIERMERE